MDIDINPEALKTARKEASEDLKVFTDDMDLTAFLAAAETYVNKSTDQTTDVAILRTWLFGRLESFEKHYSTLILKDCWKKLSDKINEPIIHTGALDKIKVAAGYVLKEITNKPTLCWCGIKPEESNTVTAEIMERFAGRCSVEKNEGSGITINFDCNDDWEQATKLYPKAIPYYRKYETKWMLDE